MGGCQNYGPFLGTLNIGIIGTLFGYPKFREFWDYMGALWG